VLVVPLVVLLVAIIDRMRRSWKYSGIVQGSR
jgi:hypothetical protein